MTPYAYSTCAGISLVLLLSLSGSLATAQEAPHPSLMTGVSAPQFPTSTEGLTPRGRRLANTDAGLTVDLASRSASQAFYNTVYLASENIDPGWNGDVANCLAGTTTVDYQAATRQRVNWFRAMAGVPANITFDAGFSAKTQQAALMMAANKQLSHSPGSSWLCYTAEGAEAAGNSNIALGFNMNNSGSNAISGYVEDPGSGNGAVGHRRWILYPQTQVMGTGDVPFSGSGSYSSNALWVFDNHVWDARPAVRDDFIAWPPKGFVPYQTVYPRWSISYPNANFSSAQVSMTKDGHPVSVTQEAYHTGYGENTLVWIPSPYTDRQDWARPVADERYDVSVSNVVVNGQPRTFEYTVTVFDPAANGATYTLTVGKTGASGTITSTPSGIDCGNTCTAEFDPQTTVTLNTTADAGYSFSGWSGDCSGTSANCTLKMDAAKNVTALFANTPSAYLLTLKKAGTGSGTISMGGSYVAGATVTLKATPAAGSIFAGWSPSPCAASFKMPANALTCTATFNLSTISTSTLKILVAGSGTGTVTGAGKYASGAAVTLKATPAKGSVFVTWAPNTCANSFKMPNRPLTCVAIFSTSSYTLSTVVGGLGSGTVTGAGSYAEGATVALKATPTAGSTFVGWTPAPCGASFIMPKRSMVCAAIFN